MNIEDILQALREHRGSAVALAPGAPADLAIEVEHALPQLDDQARALAALCVIRRNGPESGPVLLRMTGDTSSQVSIKAATGLFEKVPMTDAPTADAILTVIPQRKNEAVRGYLYLMVGRRNGTPDDDRHLTTLRKLEVQESDKNALQRVQVAATRLGGQPERAAFLERIRAAGPDEATNICDQLVYVGDPRLAKGMMPWFGNMASVFRLGSDRDNRMARMCDLAVWTAHELGVTFAMTPKYLSNFSQGTLTAAETALKALTN